ncbi:MAG: HesA/MoeB/ThiF family protein [Planctomycetota bacterium]|jgi:molybdopterin/thiamine biosynthesis adenylyltransferase
MLTDRFDRNTRFFGEEGQQRLRATRCAVIGAGGLGTHVIQQLALLGVGAIDPIDHEELDQTNRNRYVGARHDDPTPGSKKVNLAERLIHSIDPGIEVSAVADSFVSDAAYDTIRRADYVFGCLDSEGARLILTEVCSAYARAYIDLASDIVPGDTPDYGGRVCISLDGISCMSCLDVLDKQEAGRELGGRIEGQNREAIYGIDRDELRDAGPSVVSINGVVASLAVTEFMVAVTGMRPSHRLLNYNGRTGKVTISIDQPQPDCWYCKSLWGQGEAADVEKHIRSRLADRL